MESRSSSREIMHASLPPFLFEEIFHHGGALLFEHSAHHGCLGVEGFGRISLIAPLLIFRSKDKTAELTPCYGTCTHDTWLHGDVECASVEILATKIHLGSCYGLHLGMCCHVMQGLGKVVASAYNSSVCNHYSSDGYLVLC